jgi:hypothetical protein
MEQYQKKKFFIKKANFNVLKEAVNAKKLIFSKVMKILIVQKVLFASTYSDNFESNKIKQAIFLLHS